MIVWFKFKFNNWQKIFDSIVVKKSTKFNDLKVNQKNILSQRNESSVYLDGKQEIRSESINRTARVFSQMPGISRTKD